MDTPIVKANWFPFNDVISIKAWSELEDNIRQTLIHTSQQKLWYHISSLKYQRVNYRKGKHTRTASYIYASDVQKQIHYATWSSCWTFLNESTATKHRTVNVWRTMLFSGGHETILTQENDKQSIAWRWIKLGKRKHVRLVTKINKLTSFRDKKTEIKIR